MEDGFGPILYIIITAVALIITALGKRRKQQQRAPMIEQQESAVEDLFQSFEFEENKQKTTIPDKPEETTEEKQIPVSDLGMGIEEGVSALQESMLLTEQEREEIKKEMLTDDPEHRTPDDLTAPYLTKTEESELDKIMKDFDLKRAVIYSEILKRKTL